MDFYTEARYAMERLAMLYYQLYGVESIGLRFFSVYGPKEECKKNYANLVSQFIWAMNKNEQPVIFGDGSQKRDFIYVRDVVHACLLSMTSKTECDVFNVGTGRCYTLNELVDLLNRLLNISIEPKYVENPIKNYVQNTLADTTKANEELGFVAEYTLEEGIKEILRRNWG
jgi:UDP-glucose 4-epimerase